MGESDFGGEHVRTLFVNSMWKLALISEHVYEVFI